MTLRISGLNLDVKGAFGYGSSRLSILFSSALVFLLVFYAYSTGVFFRVNVYPLRDRITYYGNFDLYITNQYVDHIIVGATSLLLFSAMISHTKIRLASVLLFGSPFLTGIILGNETLVSIMVLLSVPAIFSIIILDRYKYSILKVRPALTINYLAILGIALGVAGLVVTSFDVSPNLIRNYQYEIFVLFNSTSPILMLLLISCLPVKIVIEQLKSFLRVQVGSLLTTVILPLRTKLVLLSLFMSVSCILVVIPHLPSINITNQYVGVDTGFYLNWVTELSKSRDLPSFIDQAFIKQSNGERPLTLITLLGLTHLVAADPATVIEYFPLFLAPALVLAVYVLARELTQNDITSVLAAFVTAVSYHTLIGIYAGFYANWLALIVGYVATTFLLKCLRRFELRYLILFAFLMMVLHFTHTYTWTVLSIVLGVYLVVSFLTKIHNKKSIALLLIVIFGTVAVDLARVQLTGSSGGVERDIEIAKVQTGSEQFLLRWNNLNYSVTTFLGGLFANFVILGVSLFWLIQSKIRDMSTIFMIIFLSIGIIPILFGDYVVQTRVLYNIPFAIPVALALTSMTKGSRSVIFVALFIWLLAVAVYSVTNFHFVPPT